MASTLCKIHVNNSTGVSLNERFTAITTQPKVSVTPARSRSRSVERAMPRVDQATSRANQRLLAELQRKHKLQAAMKLKRRSMRTIGGGGTGGGAYGRIKRGSVKALRVGANGKPIRTNSLSNIATMNADRELLKRRASPAPLRRSNSSGNLANRLGPRRPVVGGAAQRVARRRLDRQRGGVIDKRGRSLASGRGRSRSRTRVQENGGRGRSRSRQNNNATAVAPRGRSRSRSRNPVRSRSLSRNRGRDINAKKSNLPVKARLGVRPGENVNNATNQRNRNRRRTSSLSLRGVQTGRVQKRRNSTNATTKNNGSPRSRSVTRNTNGQNQRSRSRSRTRKGQVGQTRNGQGQSPQKKGTGGGQTQQRGGRGQAQPKRGRSQQRRRGINSAQKGSNNSNRRGRSRSRTGGRGGQRSQGKNDPYVGKTTTKETVKKEDLDKELDQYMATTKTENDMDFLLKN
ncbi:serine/arginine repetitive matrix protein 2 [Musca vetustissima]|uniref:serine/arginine repetitive matrix protein 2 n=1 Tax=Musca vetustissima TaxID=27455 RepID=UPI002AB6971F|nr:serine/arginine repetitive matrix protein 2 [Musca vetustissima]